MRIDSRDTTVWGLRISSDKEWNRAETRTGRVGCVGDKKAHRSGKGREMSALVYPLLSGDRLNLSHIAFMTTALADVPTIHLSRGFDLRKKDGRFQLHGAQQAIDLPADTLDAVSALARASAMTGGASFMGFGDRIGFLVARPVGHAIEGDQLVEALIRPSDIIKNHLRGAAERVTGTVWSNQVYEEILFLLMKLVGEGHINAMDFETILANGGLHDSAPHRYAFFYANVQIAIEDMRTVLLRAMNRFSAAHRIATRINSVRPAWHEPLIAPWEIRHSSPATQALYDAYVDCVLACSSTLDLLYKLLIYVSTEPLGSPVSPGRLELPLPRPGRPPPNFPRAIRTKVNDLGKETAPYALSNLGPGAFFGLRGWRNELSHNLGPVAFELPVYIGEGGAPANGCALQYIQFMAPDLDGSGDLASHPWVPRFYKQRRDAFDQLHTWLQETSLASFDTFSWIIRRLDHRAASQ